MASPKPKENSLNRFFRLPFNDHWLIMATPEWQLLKKLRSCLGAKWDIKVLKKVSKSANNGRLKWARSKQLEQAFILVYTTTLPPSNSAQQKGTIHDGFSSGYCCCCWPPSDSNHRWGERCMSNAGNQWLWEYPLSKGFVTSKQQRWLSPVTMHGLIRPVQWQ